MKYVIDIPDNMIIKSALNGLTLGIPMSVSATQKEYVIPTNLQLDPYVKPDRKAIDLRHARDIENVAKMNYNEGAKDAWELANYMGRMSLTERDLCFGFPLPQEVTMNLSYNEAKSKFEAWLKQKDEIHVGDEVENASHKEGIVINHHISPSNGLEYVRVLYMDDDGNSFISAWEKNNVCKTGRHFDEVEELLEKMMG